jgi:hypothetical protein
LNLNDDSKKRLREAVDLLCTLDSNNWYVPPESLPLLFNHKR